MVQGLVNMEDDEQLLSAFLIEILSHSRQREPVHCHDEGTMMILIKENNEISKHDGKVNLKLACSCSD